MRITPNARRLAPGFGCVNWSQAQNDTGSNKGAMILASSVGNLLPTSFTATMWMFLSGVYSNYTAIFNFYDSTAANNGITWFDTQGTPSGFQVNADGNNCNTGNFASFPNWYFCAIVGNGTTVTQYFRRRNTGWTTASCTNTTQTANLNVVFGNGNNSAPVNSAFRGGLSDCHLYNYPMTKTGLMLESQQRRPRSSSGLVADLPWRNAGQLYVDAFTPSRVWTAENGIGGARTLANVPPVPEVVRSKTFVFLSRSATSFFWADEPLRLQPPLFALRPRLFDDAFPTATAPLKLYVLDATAAGSSHGSLQVGGAAPGVSTTATGFDPGTALASNYADMVYGSNVPTGSFGSTAKPNAAPGASNCWRSTKLLTGSFAAGSWSFACAFIGQSAITAVVAGNLRIRVWHSPDPSGLTAQTEITSSTVSLSQVANLLSSAQQNTTATATLPAATLLNEYLFIECAWQVDTVSVGAAAGLWFVQDGANSLVTTASWFPAALAVNGWAEDAPPRRPIAMRLLDDVMLPAMRVGSSFVHEPPARANLQTLRLDDAYVSKASATAALLSFGAFVEQPSVQRAPAKPPQDDRTPTSGTPRGAAWLQEDARPRTSANRAADDPQAFHPSYSPVSKFIGEDAAPVWLSVRQVARPSDDLVTLRSTQPTAFGWVGDESLRYLPPRKFVDDPQAFHPGYLPLRSFVAAEEWRTLTPARRSTDDGAVGAIARAGALVADDARRAVAAVAARPEDGFLSPVAAKSFGWAPTDDRARVWVGVRGADDATAPSPRYQALSKLNFVADGVRPYVYRYVPPDDSVYTTRQTLSLAVMGWYDWSPTTWRYTWRATPEAVFSPSYLPLRALGWSADDVRRWGAVVRPAEDATPGSLAKRSAVLDEPSARATGPRLAPDDAPPPSTAARSVGALGEPWRPATCWLAARVEDAPVFHPTYIALRPIGGVGEDTRPAGTTTRRPAEDWSPFARSTTPGAIFGDERFSRYTPRVAVDDAAPPSRAALSGGWYAEDRFPKAVSRATGDDAFAPSKSAAAASIGWLAEDFTSRLYRSRRADDGAVSGAAAKLPSIGWRADDPRPWIRPSWRPEDIPALSSAIIQTFLCPIAIVASDQALLLVSASDSPILAFNTSDAPLLVIAIDECPR